MVFFIFNVVWKAEYLLNWFCELEEMQTAFDNFEPRTSNFKLETKN